MIDVPPDLAQAAAPPLVHDAATTGLCALLVVSLLYALWDWRKSGAPIVLCCVLGGVACISIEPWVDVLGGCWHWERGQIEVFETFDRAMPLWLVFAYGLFFGIQPALMQKWFARGVASRQILTFWASAFVVNLTLELPLLYGGLYVYYGAQPLEVFGFPLWWMGVNGFGVVLIAVVVDVLAPWIKRAPWRAILLIPLAPAADGAANAASGPLVWTVIHTPTPAYLVHAAGIASIIVSGVLVFLVSKLVAQDSAHRLAARA